MSVIDVTMYAAHLLFAGLWTGSVAFVALAVVPAARAGTMDAAPLRAQTERLRWLSRASALVLLLSGGHTATQRYTAASLTGTTNGYLVLAMVALWLAMSGLVEVAGGRLADGLARDKVRDPARAATPLLYGATACGAVLLVIGGVLAAA